MRAPITMAAALGLALSTLTGGEALAQSAGPVMAPETLGAPVTLERTARFEVPGAQGPLVVQVTWPAAPPPPAGYGIIYALDAGWTLGTLGDALMLQGSAQAAGPVRPTVLVGIGWPGPGMIDLARRGPDLAEPEGAQATLAVLTETIVPRVEAALPVDPAHRMVLGHSFGGAFALRAGFARPDLFSHVGAGSPSLWTDPEGLVAPPEGTARPQVLITMGGLERPEAAAAAGTDPARVKRLAERDMAGRIARMSRDLAVPLIEFPGLSHGASATPFLAAAVAFLWR